MQTEKRNNKIILVLGRRGAGKTYYARNFLLNYRNVHPQQKALVVDTFRSPKYMDIAAIDPEEVGRWEKPNTYFCYSSNTNEINAALTNLYNALVIYEDATKFFDSNNLPPEMKKYLIDTKQKNVDILMLFHGWTFTPPKLFRLCDEIVLLKTNDSPKNRRQDIPEYELLLKTYEDLSKSKDPYARAHIKIT